jgi:hypothetical protein
MCTDESGFVESNVIVLPYHIDAQQKDIQETVDVVSVFGHYTQVSDLL